MPKIPRVKVQTRYILICAASFIVSVAGIVYGALHDTADGGRGGAIAVAIAFVTLFVRPDFGSVAYRTVKEEFPKLRSALLATISRLEDLPPPQVSDRSIEELKDSINGMFSEIHVNNDGQNIQNKVIALASVLGTLAWGFGDIAACHLKPHLIWLKNLLV